MSDSADRKLESGDGGSQLHIFYTDIGNPVLSGSLLWNPALNVSPVTKSIVPVPVLVSGGLNLAMIVSSS